MAPTCVQNVWFICLQHGISADHGASMHMDSSENFDVSRKGCTLNQILLIRNKKWKNYKIK